MKRNNDQVSLSQKSELSKLESESFRGTHPPARLGEVLLQLLGDRGVDVPLALLARDPAVLEGITTKKKKALTTNTFAFVVVHIFVFCSRAFTTKKKKHSKPTFAFVVFGSCICFLLKGIPIKQRTSPTFVFVFSIYEFVFCSRAFL